MGKFLMLTVHEVVMYPYKQTLICDGAHNKAVTFFTLEQSIDHKGAKGKVGLEMLLSIPSGFPALVCRIGSVDGCVAPDQGRGRHSFIHSRRLVCTTT
jgi:hypothetical protein